MTKKKKVESNTARYISVNAEQLCSRALSILSEKQQSRVVLFPGVSSARAF
jgi:hypothetical protein